MITISNGTPDDCPAVAAMWNARTTHPSSCWYQVAETTPPQVATLIANGHTMILVKHDGSLTAFGLVDGPTVNALCASTQADLYRLLLEWSQQNIAQGRAWGSSIVGTRTTSEKTWIDALGDALSQAPYGVDPDTHQTELLNVTCDFQTLAAALDEQLGMMES